MRRRIIRWAARHEGHMAWVLLAASFMTFLGVLTNLIATGNAKWATLIVAADLFVTSASALQEAYGEELDDEGGGRR